MPSTEISFCSCGAMYVHFVEIDGNAVGLFRMFFFGKSNAEVRNASLDGRGSMFSATLETTCMQLAYNGSS